MIAIRLHFLLASTPFVAILSISDRHGRRWYQLFGGRLPYFNPRRSARPDRSLTVRAKYPLIQQIPNIKTVSEVGHDPTRGRGASRGFSSLSVNTSSASGSISVRL